MEAIKIGNNSVLSHLLDHSNTLCEEVNIFLSKHLVTIITTQSFGFGYTTAYGTSHHWVTPFAFPILYPTTMDQLDITQQVEDRDTMITVADKKNMAKLPSPLPPSYTEILTVIQNYQALLKVLFSTPCQHFTQVKNITQTFKSMFLWNNRIINEIQKAYIIWEIYFNTRAFFGTIEIAAYLHNGTETKSSLQSIYVLIGASISLALEDVPSQIYTSTQKMTGSRGSGGEGVKPRNAK